jgi:hypothetical protein
MLHYRMRESSVGRWDRWLEAANGASWVESRGLQSILAAIYFNVRLESITYRSIPAWLAGVRGPLILHSTLSIETSRPAWPRSTCRASTSQIFNKRSLIKLAIFNFRIMQQYYYQAPFMQPLHRSVGCTNTRRQWTRDVDFVDSQVQRAWRRYLVIVFIILARKCIIQPECIVFQLIVARFQLWSMQRSERCTVEMANSISRF